MAKRTHKTSNRVTMQFIAELFKLSMCIFGTMFLFIGLVSLINTMPDLFFLSLPINLLFVLWFHYQLVKKY